MNRHNGEHHYLLIPPNGLMEVFHAEEPIDVRTVLTNRGGHGSYFSMRFIVDGNPEARAEWFVNSTGPVNPRAREAFEYLTGVHMLFTDSLMLWGINPERVGEMVARLSRRE